MCIDWKIDCSLLIDRSTVSHNTCACIYAHTHIIKHTHGQYRCAGAICTAIMSYPDQEIHLVHCNKTLKHSWSLISGGKKKKKNVCASPISASTIGKEGVGGRSSVPVLVGDSEGGSHSVRPTQRRDLDHVPVKRYCRRGRRLRGIKWTARRINRWMDANSSATQKWQP